MSADKEENDVSQHDARLELLEDDVLFLEAFTEDSEEARHFFEVMRKVMQKGLSWVCISDLYQLFKYAEKVITAKAKVGHQD